MYGCPPGYNLNIDLDANTQWCQGEKDINDIKPAQPVAQAMGIIGMSSVAAGALLFAAVIVSATRPKPKRQRRRR